MEKRFMIIKNIVLTINLFIFFFLVCIGRNEYIYDMTYSRCIIFMIINSIFIYTYGIFLNKEEVYKLNILIYILLYFILLISITFFIGRVDIEFNTSLYFDQIKPFHTIISQFKYGSKLSFLKNIIGNCTLFIPFSFLLMINNLKYRNILKQSIIILPTIIIIEFFQIFTHTGSFDIDDIILNYMGVVIFTFIITRFKFIDKIRTLFYTDFKLKKYFKYLLFCISLSILIIYNIIIFI